MLTRLNTLLISILNLHLKKESTQRYNKFKLLRNFCLFTTFLPLHLKLSIACEHSYVQAALTLTNCLIPYNNLLRQWFSTCGTRTTSGTRRLFRWYVNHFHYFYTKAWIHSFLVFCLSSFVSKNEFCESLQLLLFHKSSCT